MFRKVTHDVKVIGVRINKKIPTIDTTWMLIPKNQHAQSGLLSGFHFMKSMS